jgi:EAL and modified HD-GYP domain-containing signal transduction protein
VGLLSTLDSVFDAPLPQVVEPLPLPAVLIDAILKREGRLGEILDAVLSYEICEFEPGGPSGIDVDLLQQAFWDSTETARGLIAQLESARPNLRRP